MERLALVEEAALSAFMECGDLFGCAVKTEQSEDSHQIGHCQGPYLYLECDDYTVHIGLLADQAALQQVAAQMLEIDLSEEEISDEEVQDATGEIINIVAGGVKQRMAQTPFHNISIPGFHDTPRTIPGPHQDSYKPLEFGNTRLILHLQMQETERDQRIAA